MPPAKKAKSSVSFYAPAYLAELIGAFGLTLMVSLSLVASDLTPIVAAITLAIFVYTIGPISGCHINPAVTLGLYSVKKIKSFDAAMYIIYQMIGAMLAMFTARYLSVAPNVQVFDTMEVGIAEAIGAAFFLFGISAVANKKVSSGASGMVVGGSLLLGIIAASTMSNGILNPAVALGIGSLSLYYVVGPVVGAVVGCWLYQQLIK